MSAKNRPRVLLDQETFRSDKVNIKYKFKVMHKSLHGWSHNIDVRKKFKFLNLVKFQPD